MAKKTWGQLAIINLYGCDRKVYDSRKKLEDFPKEVCKVIDMKPIDKPIVKRFGKGKLNGYSLMQFIETSSITAHTDESKNRVFLDIFSCKKFNSKKAVKFAKEYFKAKRVQYKTIMRD